MEAEGSKISDEFARRFLTVPLASPGTVNVYWPQLSELQRRAFPRGRWNRAHWHKELRGKWKMSFVALKRGMYDYHIGCPLAGYVVAHSSHHTAHVSAIAVSEDCRYQGVATHLLESVRCAARSSKLKVITTVVDCGNAAAKCFWSTQDMVPLVGGMLSSFVMQAWPLRAVEVGHDDFFNVAAKRRFAVYHGSLIA